ncbi:phosphoribosylanthranilate isomerase [Butyrivibrio sp. WCE2006]|uniref:phosphoribosylanthranilate isomerase n=1 Tax=Butyrivibrio sp. WCE2006 TaxID=1410611 RepID=UPI0005D2A25A|nr:phosphoribosylanthranilate isomerase [Butyrivibrio sp. WCE2006]
MTKIKFCGLRREQDITISNELRPDYIGFVFWEKSKRYVTFEEAKGLKQKLDKSIKAVGVFVDEEPEVVAEIANNKTIDIIQLHGHEDEEYIEKLRKMTDAKIIKAFQIRNVKGIESGGGNGENKKIDRKIEQINNSSADMVLIDSGQGTGKAFNWEILQKVTRPYFLAGGINIENIEEAIQISPFAIDVSSGIETGGVKNEEKMKKIVAAKRSKQ